MLFMGRAEGGLAHSLSHSVFFLTVIFWISSPKKLWARQRVFIIGLTEVLPVLKVFSPDSDGSGLIPLNHVLIIFEINF